MTDDREIRILTEQIAQRGARVTLTFDSTALVREGRLTIETVQITGMPGVGPFPMGAIAAAEKMRALLANQPAPTYGFCA